MTNHERRINRTISLFELSTPTWLLDKLAFITLQCNWCDLPLKLKKFIVMKYIEKMKEY